ncbi:MAG: TrkH family potassium uptake protein [Alphaproteobacteria bacterium]|nr:TrkH family potassium uptake protein [Alphaproteobacteria bacterium]
MAAQTVLSEKRAPQIQLSPPAILLLLYAGCMSLGALLLSLPFASNEPTTFFEALFTSVSAVTVTGLVVVDTGSHYSFWGQMIIAILIQLGGLGLMTFSVLILAMLGIRISSNNRALLREDLNQTDLGSLLRLVFLIFKVVFLLEVLGAGLLALHFVPEFGWCEGIWQSIFHSISAFNNAGFGLFPDSLTRWAGDYLVNLVIPALFIIGGLGYSVLMDLSDKRCWRKLTLHSKLMLSGTGVLIIFAFSSFMMLEWSNPQTLGVLDTPTKIMVSWFQAVTPRTAGFNTVDIGALKDSTALLLMPLMVIGGGSTSTAGGIKVTSFIVMLLAVIAFFKRRNQISVFGRSLETEQILKVMALVTISLMLIITSLFLITLTNNQNFLDLLFEVCSAFGTVGLSRGITADLDGFGQTFIILIMFFGRVGPLTLGFFLATRSAPRVKYPSDQVLFG